MSLADIPGFAALSIAEKLQLVEDLWDDIAASEAVPFPDRQKAELARRKVAFEAAPDSGLTWEEVKVQVRTG